MCKENNISMNCYYSGFMHALIFVVGLLTGFTILYLNPSDWVKELSSIFIPSIAVLLAAYFGAKFAFIFQENKEKEKERIKNETVGRKAIFKLDEIINNLAYYENNIIDTIKTNKEIHEEFYFFTLLPTVVESMKVDLDPYDLLFISKRKHVSLVPEYVEIKTRYNSLLDTISFRSEVHKESQKILSRKVKSASEDLEVETIIEIIGISNYRILQDLTNSIISVVPKLLIDTAELIQKINFALKDKYPDMEIISVDISPHKNRNMNETT